MSRISLVCLAALALSTLPNPLASPRETPVPADSSPSSVASAPGRGGLPVVFGENLGQAPDGVRFLCHTRDYMLTLERDGAAFTLGRSGDAPTLRMRVRGADSSVGPEGRSRLAGVHNYFLGNDPSRWIQGVPLFGEVRYPDVCPGVSLEFHTRGGDLEYDFLVSPGADPSRIEMVWEGSEHLDVDGNGDLVARLGEHVLRQAKPELFQEVGGRRRSVEGEFVLCAGGRVGFRVGDYDPTRLLVIDPRVGYSRYLGGSDDDFASAIAVDASGNSYVTGFTSSRNFPSRSSFLRVGGTGQDVFVTKLTSTGALSYTSFLGGAATEQGYGIALDPWGEVYVGGMTESANFPAPQGIRSALSGASDGFVAHLDASGKLTQATYLGGSNEDAVRSVAFDPTGDVWVTGDTDSADFPQVGGLSSHRGQRDIFVTQIGFAGPSMVLWCSTLLGGSWTDIPSSIAVDDWGQPYVTGTTWSDDFPTVRPIRGFSGSVDGFLLRLKSNGSAISYSTLLGGSARDDGHGVAVDASGAAFVAGVTASADFPATTPAWVRRGEKDPFLLKVSPAGDRFEYGVIFGGSRNEWVAGVALDPLGRPHVAGSTQSTDLPLFGTFDLTSGDFSDSFVAGFDPDWGGILYSVRFGGSDADGADGIAVGPDGHVHVTGSTSSTDFPTRYSPTSTSSGGGLSFPNSFSLSLSLGYDSPTAPSGLHDGFVVKFDPLLPAPVE